MCKIYTLYAVLSTDKSVIFCYTFLKVIDRSDVSEKIRKFRKSEKGA